MELNFLSKVSSSNTANKKMIGIERGNSGQSDFAAEISHRKIH
jgi:hypothetical protein